MLLDGLEGGFLTILLSWLYYDSFLAIPFLIPLIWFWHKERENVRREYPSLFLVPLVRNASLNADYKTSFNNLHIKKYLLFLFFYAVYISKLIGLINRKLQ